MARDQESRNRRPGADGVDAALPRVAPGRRPLTRQNAREAGPAAEQGAPSTGRASPAPAGEGSPIPELAQLRAGSARQLDADNAAEDANEAVRETILLYAAGTGGEYVGYHQPGVGLVRQGRPEGVALHAGVVDSRGVITARYRLNDPADDQNASRLIVHDPEEIQLVLDDSRVNEDHGFLGKYRFAYEAGGGMPLEYSSVATARGGGEDGAGRSLPVPGMRRGSEQEDEKREPLNVTGLMDYQTYFEMGLHAIRGDRTAYNHFDFGNHVWGMGIRRLGLSRATSVLSSQANAFLFAHHQNADDSMRFKLDDPADQRAIARGYDSSIARNRPEDLDRGSLQELVETEAVPVDGGLELRIALLASPNARYRDLALFFSELGQGLITPAAPLIENGQLVVTHYVPWFLVPDERALPSGELHVDAQLKSALSTYRSDLVSGTIDIRAARARMRRSDSGSLRRVRSATATRIGDEWRLLLVIEASRNAAFRTLRLDLTGDAGLERSLRQDSGLMCEPVDGAIEAMGYIRAAGDTRLQYEASLEDDSGYRSEPLTGELALNDDTP